MEDVCLFLCQDLYVSLYQIERMGGVMRKFKKCFKIIQYLYQNGTFSFLT